MTTCAVCKNPNFKTVATGVRDFEYGAPGDYSWVQCDGCGLIRIDPIPSDEILNLAYPPEYHAFQPPSSGLTRHMVQYSRQSLAKVLARKLGNQGAILDVGCSTGELLAAVGQEGQFDLFGIEYSEQAAEQARKKGITTWSGTIETAELPPEGMDLITMQHVLEHVVDPSTTLEKSRSALKVGGRLMGEIPNFDSWDAKLFGKYWGGGHAPRHIWHFTPKTLTQTLETCGYCDVKISPALHTGHWALSAQNYLRRNKKTSRGLTFGRTWYYPLLLLTFIPLNLLQMPLMKTGIMRFEATRA